MKFLKKFLSDVAILLIFFVASCSQKPAKIANHSRDFYSKGSQSSKVKNRNSFEEKKSKNHQVEVTSGDTLFSLSKKHQVTLHDLIRQNNLVPPYNLKTGTKLSIPAPAYHEVKSGETIYAISRAYNMKIDNLIEMNDLKAPYSLKVGEKVRIANFSDNQLASSPVIPEKTATEQTSSQVAYRLSGAGKLVEKKLEFVENTFVKSSGFSWPLKGQIISKFGPKNGGLYNDGINIKAKQGAEVKSSETGLVAYVGNELKGYGNLVILKHSGGWITAYAHLENTIVKRGEKVAKGTKIGTVGMTGNVNSPQLYFALRKGRDAVNPENYLK
jgi:LysM repeat protein